MEEEERERERERELDDEHKKYEMNIQDVYILKSRIENTKT